MSLRRAVKVRLYPNKHQQELLQKHFRAFRYVYNRSLALKKYAYEKFGVSISANRLIKRLPILKERHPWLNEIDSQVLQQSIRHLDEAFKHFFRRVKNGETPGFPKFTSKKNVRQSFQYPQRVKIERSRVYLPKIGWIRARGLRDDLSGSIKTVTITYEAHRYYASILFEIEAEPIEIEREPIGIDVGVANALTDSDGNQYSIEDYSPRFQKELAKLVRLQKALARNEKGLRKREKAKIRLAKQYRRIADMRYNFLHQVSAKYSESQAFVEELNIKAMTKSAKGTKENPDKKAKAKSALNHSILQIGWGLFFQLLEYKTNDYVVKVDAKYTSQTCSRGGYRDKENRISQARFVCKSCGYKIHTDINAASEAKRESRRVRVKNILAARGIHGENARLKPKVA